MTARIGPRGSADSRVFGVSMSAPALTNGTSTSVTGRASLFPKHCSNHAPRLCNFGSRSAGKEIAGAIVQGALPPLKALKEPLQGHLQSGGEFPDRFQRW